MSPSLCWAGILPRSPPPRAGGGPLPRALEARVGAGGEYLRERDQPRRHRQRVAVERPLVGDVAGPDVLHQLAAAAEGADGDAAADGPGQADQGRGGALTLPAP